MDRQEYLTRMALYFKARERSEAMSKTAFDWGEFGNKAMGWIKDNYDKAGPALLLALLGGWAGNKAAGPAGGMLGALLGGTGGWYGRRALNDFGSFLESTGAKEPGQPDAETGTAKTPAPVSTPKHDQKPAAVARKPAAPAPQTVTRRGTMPLSLNPLYPNN